MLTLCIPHLGWVQHAWSEDRSNTMTAPEQFGRYHVTGELGRGGMGVVYRGEDRLIGREVAIKTLTAATPELRERFFVEARSGVLSHPNIVTVYELGEHEGSPFIAMEFIAGESLEKVLRTRKRLPLLEALSIMEQLCAGLGYAHGYGVVHRDVKPANILIRPDGRVTIVDFGIAQLADQTQQLTRADALLGTFHYIAPERLKGEESDGRVDVWSAGVILYEMLTGELPFKGTDVSSLYRMINEPYVALTEYVQDLPEGLSGVLDKALAKRVEDRYLTAEEVSFDLQVIAEGLKKDRVDTLLETARRLTQERQFASARTVLLQAQRIDPSNADAKSLIHDVQTRLSQLQRGEQLRQIAEQAQTALSDRRWDDAIAFYQQAMKLDLEDALGLGERLQSAQEQKRQQQQLVALREQANEARKQGDLTQAQQYLKQALAIDERNTDLRNAHAVILREIERRQRGLHVEEHLQSARESYGAQQYTEAITHLRKAAELDPSRTEVQQLLFTVVARQKEERRQRLLEKIAAEIQESLDREEFTLAQDRVARALETLPGEALLLRLKSEVEARKHAFEVEQVVRETVLAVQDLFLEDPAQALETIERGLKVAPESDTLKQSQARIQEHLRDLDVEAARSEALMTAHAALDRKQYREARLVLEPVIVAHGATADLSHLLALAKAGQNKQERDAAESQRVEETRTAIASALTAFEKALESGDLKRCMRPVEELVRQRGSERGVDDAVRRCEVKRDAAANHRLAAAIEKAHGLMRRSLWKEASGELRRADFIVSFATQPLNREYTRVRAECAAAAHAARRKHGLSQMLRRVRPRWYAAGVVLLGVVFAAATMLHEHHRRASMQAAALVEPSRPKPVPALLPTPQTDLEINATPWARVLRVQREDGTAVALPDGRPADTPLRLDRLTVGRYTITLADGGGEEHTLTCRISATDHLCAAAIGSIDVPQLLAGDAR